MKTFRPWIVLSTLVAALGMFAHLGRSEDRKVSASPPQVAINPSAKSEERTLERPGQTTYAPGRRAEIAPTVMHPVIRILVQPGDVVKAGQPLVEIDSEEPAAAYQAQQAEVVEKRSALARLKAYPRTQERAEAEAQLQSAEIAGKAAKEYLDRLTELRRNDAVSERQFIEQQTVFQQAEADRRAAAARLDYLLNQPVEHELAEAEAQVKAAEAEAAAAKHQLSHYSVRAAIDGIVARLDVALGSVHEAGTNTWGEIVDLREVDVRVNLSPQELRRVDRTQPVEIGLPELDDRWTAKVAYVSPVADPESGRIPVVLRVTNADGRLPVNVFVTAKFSTLPVIGAAQLRPTE